MTEPTSVWLRGRLVGAFTPTRRAGATFKYAAEVVDGHRDQRLLSTALQCLQTPSQLVRHCTGVLPADLAQDIEVAAGAGGSVRPRSARATRTRQCDDASTCRPAARGPRLDEVPGHPYDDNEALPGVVGRLTGVGPIGHPAGPIGGAPRLDLQRLVEQPVVNVALGNTDAHAKDYGVLHPSDASASLSPMYDVVPAAVVNLGQLEMGLRVDKTLRLDRVTDAKLVGEAGSWGLGARVAQICVEATLVGLQDAITEVEPSVSGHTARLTADCSDRVERLLTSL